MKFILEDFFENVSFLPFDQSNPIDPDLLNKMSASLQKGIDLLRSFRPLFNTDNADHGDTIGEQSNENRTTSGLFVFSFYSLNILLNQ
jgi:hypothetical protein